MDKAVDEAIEALQENESVLMVEKGLQSSLFCKVRFSLDIKSAWLGQPHLMEN